MIKSIIHPGNGVNYPNRGDYLRVNLEVNSYLNNIIECLFKETIIIRLDYDNNIIIEIINLLKEMTLLEKCCLDDNTNNKQYIIELVEINSNPITN